MPQRPIVAPGNSGIYFGCDKLRLAEALLIFFKPCCDLLDRLVCRLIIRHNEFDLFIILRLDGLQRSYDRICGIIRLNDDAHQFVLLLHFIFPPKVSCAAARDIPASPPAPKRADTNSIP